MCFQAFSHHGAIRRGAFRRGGHGDLRLRHQEDRDHAALAATIDNEAAILNSDPGIHIVPFRDTTQKHVIQHIICLYGTLHRHRRHHRDRQHVVKPCCSVTHPCTKNFGLPQPQNGPRSPKNLENEPLSSFFFFFLTTVPQMVENTLKNELEISKKKKRIFAMCHFPQVRSKFL